MPSKPIAYIQLRSTRAMNPGMKNIHIKAFARPNSGHPSKPYKASFDGEYPQTAEHDPPKKRKHLISQEVVLYKNQDFTTPSLLVHQSHKVPGIQAPVD
jgi:hypothetical protein